MPPEEQSAISNQGLLKRSASFLQRNSKVLSLILLVVVVLLGTAVWLVLDTSVESVEPEFSAEVLSAAKASVINALQTEFGFTPGIFNDLYIEDQGVNNMHVDVQPYSGALNESGKIIVTEDIDSAFYSDPKETDVGIYGSVLIGTASIRLPQVTWVTYQDTVPVIISTTFNAVPVDEAALRSDFVTSAPILLTSLLERYPSDTALTKALHEGMRMVRTENRGYAVTKILNQAVSTEGYVFVLTEFDNFASISNSCEMFLSGEWSITKAREYVSCEVMLTTGSETLIFLDGELSTLGGLPEKWISGNELVTKRMVGGEGFDNSTNFVGIFNADTKTYSNVLEMLRPGFYWRRALIEYSTSEKKERLLLVEGPNVYFLYRVLSNRSLGDYFVGLSSEGTMIDYLNPSYAQELERIGSMSLADNSTHVFDASIDSDRNIVLTFGSSSGQNHTVYTYSPSRGITRNK